MWWRKRIPEPCAGCRALLDRWAAWQARRPKKSCNHVTLLEPHGKREAMVEKGSTEVGFFVFRCGQCQTWWEWSCHSYFIEDRLRRLRVTSVAQWERDAALLNALCCWFLAPVALLLIVAL
jgi:hypothetical protein